MGAGPMDDAAATAPPVSTPRSGILLVDKPGGITSHGVVARTRRALGTRKVGHAGTLDPMATGLLVLGIGSATRLLTWVVGLDKVYETTIRLGAGSSTDDAEGELGQRASAESLSVVTDDAIAREAVALTGDILQQPSAVSAIKVDGKRAYARVRDGEEVDLPARPVRVHRFEIESVSRVTEGWIDVVATVECSSGTYIRALARDMGASLGVGGHLTTLRRTSIGPLDVTDAASLDDDLPARVQPGAAIAEKLFPVARLNEEAATDLAHGKRIALDLEDAGPVAALAPGGRLVGLVEVRRGSARVLTNFPQEEVPS